MYLSASLQKTERRIFLKGEHQAAIIQLKNVVQQQPENGEARLLRTVRGSGYALGA
jgi:hypothetical protein